VESGELDELGVTALWLSPVYRNPDVAREGNDGRPYDSYHGYWPLDGRGVDDRIGGQDAFAALVDSAHQRGVAVLLDVVPNHVYEDHPRYREHRSDGWFSPEGCVCGTADCPWNGHIERCWFAPYLPDLLFQNVDAMREVREETRFWAERYQLDGLRIDAVPMMPRSTTRRLAYELRRNVYPRSAHWLLGEVFTGPGTGAVEQLRYHLGPAGLDSVFDFPLMWALHDAIARRTGNFQAVEAVLAAEELSLAGSGAVLARILDNHDTPRFVSVANGDAAGDPWDEPAEQPDGTDPYTKLKLGFAVTFSLAGVPVIYQGDEIGLAGAGDPDNRRVMPPVDALSPAQRDVRDTVARLARLRACSSALRRGGRTPLYVGLHGYAFSRRDGAEVATLVISTAATETRISLPAAALEPGSYRDIASGEVFAADAGAPLEVPMEPLSFRILLAAGDACSAP
jgi:glycosidase